jgi:hypothetical protein
MSDRFLGITMGVRATEVEEILKSHGVTATVRKIAPPASLAFGISRKRVLDRASLRMPPFRRSVLVLMGLWGVFGSCLSFTVAAFFLAWSAGAQGTGLALSVVAASLAVVGTAVALLRVRKEGPGATLVESDLADGFGSGIWGFPATGTELDLILICFLFVLLLFLFVLYVVWLPLLLVVVSLLTFGQIWREFRGTLVSADSTEFRSLGAAAEDLLRRGAVLSKSWDLYLSASAVMNSTRTRASHYLVHRLFVATGVLSLTVAALAFMHREFPSDLWMYPIAAGIGGAVSALAVLTLMEHHRRLAPSARR